MTDIAKAYVQIVPSAQGIKGSISEVLGGEAISAGNSTGLNIGSAIKKAIVAAGIGKVVSDTIMGSLRAGGDLQQSFIGGLNTLYGDAADQMREYATAAADAGISANDFAEQAVSFGAALKSAFDNDTAKAAEAANQAIMDMADNAAKMGTDIGSIQAAYQGFAKDNYTMLDNLKLGYGGTRTEMERLLKEANEINKRNGIITDYSIENLGDIYEAIHVVQQDLGLTGVAADEAATTLTGSAGAVKAAWQNVLAFMANGMDIGPALQTLGQSLSAFVGNNLIPMLSNVLQSLPTVIAAGIQMMIQGLQNMSENSEGIASFVISLVGSIGSALIDNMPALILYGVKALTDVLHAIMMDIGGLLEEGTTTAINWIKEKISSYGIPEMLQSGINMVKEIASGFINGIADVLQKVQRVIDDVKGKFENFDWGSVGGNIISGIANGIRNGVGSIVSAAKEAAQSAFDAAKNFLGISSPSKLMEKEVGRQISAGMAVGIVKNLGMIESAMQEASAATDLRGFGLSGDLTYGYGYGTGGFTQNITVNSPTELTPSEVARQTRNATRQMALKMSGVY